MSVLFSMLLVVLAQVSLPPDCGGVIPEDMDTIPWVHKVTTVPVAAGKPCADTVHYVDLSDEMPPVGNQHWQNCCTCWGFGYYHRTHVEFLERGWDLTDPSHQGAPAFLYNQINGGQDRGSAFSRAMALMCEQGCGTMTDCPYDTLDYLTWPTEQAYLNAMDFRADSAFWFDVHDPNFVSLIRQHLANGNSCVTGIVIYSNFWDIHNYNNVYTLADMQGSPISGHAVTIVGYDDTMSTRDGTGAFRLVNSMGTAWGDSGYFWMSYQATADTRIVYGYACYVTDLIDYEPLVIGTVRFSHPTRDRVGIRFGVGTPENSLWHKDFRPWRWARQDRAFPYRRIPFDLTDGAPWLTGGPGDTLYLSCLDDTSDGRTGFADLFEVKHLGWQTQGSSTEMPLMIPDNGDTVTATLLLPFTAVSEAGAGRIREERPGPTLLRRSELDRIGGRLLDIQGRDVTDRRRALGPGVYFTGPERGGALRRVVIIGG
jgi:Papain family cysteine protease